MWNTVEATRRERADYIASLSRADYDALLDYLIGHKIPGGTLTIAEMKTILDTLKKGTQIARENE